MSPKLRRSFGHIVYIQHELGQLFSQSDASDICINQYNGTLPTAYTMLSLQVMELTAKRTSGSKQQNEHLPELTNGLKLTCYDRRSHFLS